MCRRNITSASCGHDLGWVLVHSERIRSRRAENAHCSDLYIRGAQCVFLNGACGRCVREAHGHGGCSVGVDEEEHGLGDDDDYSDTTINDDRCAAHHMSGGTGSGMRRLNGPVLDEGEPASDTYRYGARVLSPVFESTDLTDSSATIRPESSASQRQNTTASNDLERRRLLRTVRARRRLRPEDVDVAPSVTSYRASLRGGAEGGDDFESDGEYRRILEESSRVQQERNAAGEEDGVRRVLEASRQEHEAALAAREQEDVNRVLARSAQDRALLVSQREADDIQCLLAQSAQDQALLASREEADLQRLLVQSARDAETAAEAEERRMLEQTLQLSLEECPPQNEEAFMDEVACATEQSAREYMDRYGDYLSPQWREECGRADGSTTALPSSSAHFGSPSASSPTERRKEIAPAQASAAASSEATSTGRPALRRAGPRGPEPLGGSRARNLYNQYPADAAAAAREAALRRYQQSAATVSERQPEPEKVAESEDEIVGWWKDAARKSD